MSEQSLYNKHRPKSFKEMVGSPQTIKALEAKAETGEIPHVILMTGGPGLGKTTAARILKEALECSDTDYREMNCSSDRGIDVMRDIESKIEYGPMAGKSRVWVMDEFEAVTSTAQKSMKKLLEDVPSYAYFILLTNEPQKIIEPLRTRCTPFHFDPIAQSDLLDIAFNVAEAEGIKISDETLEALTESANGSARTLLVNLELVAQTPDKERKSLIKGSITEEKGYAFELVKAIHKGTWYEVISWLKKEGLEPEGVRRLALKYATTCLLGQNPGRAYNMIVAFSNNFYDSGMAGLVAACYEVLHAN